MVVVVAAAAAMAAAAAAAAAKTYCIGIIVTLDSVFFLLM